MTQISPDAKLLVSQAALAIRRSERTIYNWIEDERLATTQDAKGRTVIRYGDLLKVEPTVKRGRPRGSSTRR